MSNLLLLLGLTAAFASVAFGASLIASSVTGKRRALRVLESQVAHSVNLREREMAQSFTQRAIFPLFDRIKRLGRALTPASTKETIAHKLELAGLMGTWDADRIMALKAIGAIAGLAVSIFLTSSAGFSGGMKLLLVATCTAIGFLAPTAILSGRAQMRQETIRKRLPDTMDLLTISVEAGLGFDAAVMQVIHHVPGPLSEELARVLQEVRLGRSRADAFRQLSLRTDIPELKSFIVAVVQAEQFGVAISGILRAQATELRNKRRQRAEEAAMKVPTKILFPLVFCVLPALFIVIVGPGIIRIVKGLIGG